MVLHGIYDNGKIELKEENLPKIRAEIEIVLPVENVQSGNFQKALDIIKSYKGTVSLWTREEIHGR